MPWITRTTVDTLTDLLLEQSRNLRTLAALVLRLDAQQRLLDARLARLEAADDRTVGLLDVAAARLEDHDTALNRANAALLHVQQEHVLLLQQAVHGVVMGRCKTVAATLDAFDALHDDAERLDEEA